MIHKYEVFGLSVHSELEIPELQPAITERADVEIIYHEVPENIPNPLGIGAMYQAAHGDFLFRLNSIGAFRVKNGCTIHVDLEQDSNKDTARLFLLGSVFGALLYQRNILPIHGSAVKIHGKTIIISGNSSAGKSSLAAYMIKNGNQLLSDDITALKSSNKSIEIQLGIPHLKIWKDVLDYLGQDKPLFKVRPELEKYKMPVSDSMCKVPTKPHLIIQLESTLSEDFSIKKISGTSKFNLLLGNLYRPKYVDPLGLSRNVFQNLTLLANSISAYRVQRPLSPIQLEKLYALLVTEIIDNE